MNVGTEIMIHVSAIPRTSIWVDDEIRTQVQGYFKHEIFQLIF